MPLREIPSEVSSQKRKQNESSNHGGAKRAHFDKIGDTATSECQESLLTSEDESSEDESSEDESSEDESSEDEGSRDDTSQPPRMPLREIPVEVWENVIDELQDDIYDWSTLLACARVCRGWTARSRLQLWKSLILQRPEQVAQLAKLVRTGSWEVEECRTVTIKYGPRTLGLFAMMFAGKMPRLEELRIWGPEWKPGEMHADVFLHLSAFTSITRLTLSGIRFPSVQTFGRLVSALPGLTTLLGFDLYFKAHDLNVGAWLRRPRHLATLDLSIRYLASLHDVTHLLVGTEMASTLKEINVRHGIELGDLNESGIPALISSAGASLVSFGLALDTLADGEPAPEMDLSQLVNLQRATFDIWGSADDSVLWLCKQLASYPTSSTALRTLTLLIDVEHGHADYAGLNATTCQQLDDTLSTPPFMSLNEVLLEFDSFNTAAWEELRQLLPARLPKLAARGILRFHSGP